MVNVYFNSNIESVKINFSATVRGEEKNFNYDVDLDCDTLCNLIYQTINEYRYLEPEQKVKIFEAARELYENT